MWRKRVCERERKREKEGEREIEKERKRERERENRSGNSFFLQRESNFQFPVERDEFLQP